MSGAWKHLAMIYRIMLRYWGYMVSGLVTMLGFALLSGVSVTMVIPLFDYVFRKDADVRIVHTDSDAFIGAVGRVLSGELGRAASGSRDWSAAADRFKAVLAATDAALLLKWICIAVLALVLLKNALFYLNKVLFANLRGNVVKDARSMMFEKYLYAPLAFFGRSRVGDALVRITSDITSVSNLCIASLFNMLRNLVLVAVYATTAILLNARLFALSMALIPVYAFVVSYLGGKLKKYAKRQRVQSVNLFANIAEKLDSMYVVKAFVQEARELRVFRRINLLFFKFWRKSVLYSSINTPLSELNGTVVGVIILIVGGGQVVGGETSLGGFTAFLFAVFSTLSPIKKLTTAYINIKKAAVSLERVAEILDQPAERTATSTPVRKTSFDAAIELRDVSFSYDDGTPVLHGITFSVRKGDRVALVGKSGSGKTTLVNLLPRLYDVSAGSLTMDGIPLDRIDMGDLRRMFGIVTQESILFSGTVAENLAYGTTGDVERGRLEKAARIAYADEFIRDLPRGYDEPVRPRGSNFSGGQRQRLCIARAIVSDPPVLIFDEATSALDSDAENKVQRAIEQATGNRTVVVIAHRLSTVLSADKIIVLEKGRIVGSGTNEELLAGCRQYKELYDLQFRQDASGE